LFTIFFDIFSLLTCARGFRVRHFSIDSTSLTYFPLHDFSTIVLDIEMVLLGLGCTLGRPSLTIEHSKTKYTL
jgi:hypothetical protein